MIAHSFLPLGLLTISLNLSAMETPRNEQAAPTNTPLPQPGRKSLRLGAEPPPVNFGTFLKGKPVKSLDPDQCYIIECWSTTCGPCIAGFPRLTELAKATEGKVTTIAVNVMDPDKTEAELQGFVDRQGDRMGFRVAMDSNGVIENQWLKASPGLHSIPWSCLVVKGRIAWWGNTHDLNKDEILGLIDGNISIDERARKATDNDALEREITAKVLEPSAKGDIKSAMTAARILLKTKPTSGDFRLKQSGRLFRDEVKTLSFRLCLDGQLDEVVRMLDSETDESTFLKHTELLLQNQVPRDVANEVDQLAVRWLAKLTGKPAGALNPFYLLRARLLVAQGKMDEAADELGHSAAYVSSLERTIEFRNASHALIKIHITERHASLLIAAIDRLLAKRPEPGDSDSIILESCRARILTRLGKTHEADPVIQKLVLDTLARDNDRFCEQAHSLLDEELLSLENTSKIASDGTKRLNSLENNAEIDRFNLVVLLARLMESSGKPADGTALLQRHGIDPAKARVIRYFASNKKYAPNGANRKKEKTDSREHQSDN